MGSTHFASPLPLDLARGSWGPRFGAARTARHGGAGMSEEDVHDAVTAEDADELAGRAVHEDQHDEPELDGPEVRPHDLTPEIAIALREASRMPPEGDE